MAAQRRTARVDRARRLAKRLKEARQAKRMSQPDLAEASGVALSTVRKVEQGRSRTPGLWPVARMAAALGLPLDELVGEPVAPKEEAPEPERTPGGEGRVTLEADQGDPFQGIPGGADVYVTGKVVWAKDNAIHLTDAEIKSNRRRRKR